MQHIKIGSLQLSYRCQYCKIFGTMLNYRNNTTRNNGIILSVICLMIHMEFKLNSLYETPGELFGNSQKQMTFILSCHPCSVFDHYLLRRNIILVDPQIDFIFGNDLFCNLQRKP